MSYLILFTLRHVHYSVCCVISYYCFVCCSIFNILSHNAHYSLCCIMFIIPYVTQRSLSFNVTSVVLTCEHSLIGYINNICHLECNLLHVCIPLGQEESIKTIIRLQISFVVIYINPYHKLPSFNIYNTTFSQSLR